MLTLAVGGALVGAVVGFHFRVFFFIVPVIVAMLLLIAGAGLAHGHEFWSLLLSMLICALTIQVGYVCGVATRLMLAGGDRVSRGQDKKPAHAA